LTWRRRDLGAVLGRPASRCQGRGVFAGREFSGKINVIYPQLNRDTRTARVRVETWPIPDAALRPDMYVRRGRSTARQPAAGGWRVPEKAPFSITGKPQAVFVDKGQGRFEPARRENSAIAAAAMSRFAQGPCRGRARRRFPANFLIDAESNLMGCPQGLLGRRVPSHDRPP